MESPPEVTLSTKSWEGDYRTILTPEGIDELFGPFGRTAQRQVVLNRVADVARAESLARQLVAAGKIDRWVWAEERWPEVAKRLQLPEGWFGAAWPYSAPELCELDLSPTDMVLHIAGDVRFPAPDRWLPRALSALEAHDATIATATPPAGADWVRKRGNEVGEGWIETQLFSDQLFLARSSVLLATSVMRTENNASARYPKPGGALTFEARVGAWLAERGLSTLVDLHACYIHPVSGREGDSYHHALTTAARPLPPVGPHYPEAGSSGATGLVVSGGNVSTVAAAVASLSWCKVVVAVDVSGSSEAEEAARSAGAEVRTSLGTSRPEIARRQILSEMSGWVVDLEADQLCTGALARQLAALMSEGTAGGLEAVCQPWIGRDRPRITNFGSSRRLIAYRTDGLAFGQPLEGYPPIPNGSIRRIPPRDGAYLIHLRAPDLNALVDQVNSRSSWKAESLVLERSPSIRLPLRRFARSYFGGAWKYGRLGPRLALLEAFEEWLTIQKWREGVSGGRVAAQAEFEEAVRAELAGTDGP